MLTAREAALEEQRRTCREQHHKLITFSLYGDSTLDSVLAMLADVQERLAHIEATSRSLAAIRKRAENEVESLQLTKSIEEAKVRLHELQASKRARSRRPSASQAEIARLRSLINEASDQAAKNIERSFHR